LTKFVIRKYSIMIKHFFLLAALILSMQLIAQTGIGTTTPNASAKLDVSSSTLGFLPPRVTLTAANTFSPIVGTSSAATGLLVYNLGSVGLQAGYYYWNGANWATIATASSSGNGVTSSNLVMLYSKAYSAAIADSAISNATGYKFTVPVSGRYLFDFSSSGYLNQATMSITFKVRQGTTDLGTDVFTSANNNVHVVFTGMVEVNLQAGIIYNVFVSSSGTGVTRDAGDYDRVYYKMVAGNLPVTGQSVDYVQASLSANQSLSAVANINFNVSSGAGISLTSGGFNLLANKTYKLEAAIGGASGGYAYYGWVDNSNNLLPGGSIGAVIKAGNDHTDAPQDKAVVYYTPTVDTRVFLRVYNLSGTLTAYAPSLSTNFASTWASIQQVGSSAIVNPWTLSGTNTYNTTGNVGIGTNAPSVPLDINGAVNASALSLSNSATGVSSLILRNGDAATTFADNPQIRMGWSGSTAGTNQFAQIIHTRHNSGPTNNAIDFYLSNGTANNTITSGSTRAMSITSPGNVEITGKLDVGDPTGNVITKASGLVNTGSFVTLDNVKVGPTRTGAGGGFAGLSVGAVSTSFVADISGVFSNNAVGGTTATNITYTTTASSSFNGWGFNQGNQSTYILNDTTNRRVYRITLMIGASYNNNFISIERLF
jgi:hypothetical protein